VCRHPDTAPCRYSSSSSSPALAALAAAMRFWGDGPLKIPLTTSKLAPALAPHIHPAVAELHVYNETDQYECAVLWMAFHPGMEKGSSRTANKGPVRGSDRRSSSLVSPQRWRCPCGGASYRLRGTGSGRRSGVSGRMGVWWKTGIATRIRVPGTRSTGITAATATIQAKGQAGEATGQHLTPRRSAPVRGNFAGARAASPA
jgi:hypothetical protein